MTDGVYDPNLGVYRYDLAEGIATQDSLKTHSSASRPANDAAVKHAEALMKMTPAQQAAHLDYLSKALRAHHGDGVKDVAGANRAGLKNNAAHNASSLDQIKRDFKKFWPAVKEETLDKMVEAFAERAEAGARNIILELLSSDPAARLAFADQETLNQVSELCYHIESLETSLVNVLADTAQLKEERARAEMQQFYEDVVHQPWSPAARRRSLQFEEPSSDNINLMNEETARHLDPAMRNYLSAVERGNRR